MSIGNIEPFQNQKVKSCLQWPAYISRVKQYIKLNNLQRNKWTPLLIRVVGEATYALMCELWSPSKPESKTFEELDKLVSEHLETQSSEIAERHVFRQRRQNDGEPLIMYLQSLKHLAATCNFGVNLEENLRDQFVSGLADEVMRLRIFAEKNISYARAVELALVLEAAERDAKVSVATAVGASSSELVAGGGAAVASGSGGASQRCWGHGKRHRDECGVRGQSKVMREEVQLNRRSKRLAKLKHNYISDEKCEGFYYMQGVESGAEPYKMKVEVDIQSMDVDDDTVDIFNNMDDTPRTATK